MKARRNRIRLQKRRPRIRMESDPAPGVAWVRGRFVEDPALPLEPFSLSVGVKLVRLDSTEPFLNVPRLHLRERFRILRWIFSLLRR